MLRGRQPKRLSVPLHSRLYLQALVDFIWSTASQTTDSHEDDLVIYNQRSSLLSSVSTNVHRQGARRRLAIIFIETFKLLSTPPIHGGRFDIQRHPRLLFFPSQIRQLIHVSRRRRLHAQALF